MSMMDKEIKKLGQTALVLQGGGALGAYQVGVFQALHEAGIELDWVIGTSIGAINAAIIAGNKPADRLDRLTEFWKRVEHKQTFGFPNFFGAMSRTMETISTGLDGFFRPRAAAFMNPHAVLGAENAGYYSVDPLRKTLSDLIDFDHLNRSGVRLTVGASSVRTAEMRYFDSRNMPLGLKHILASGALPPSFPAVRIDGELYWDGGILSNTPVEVIFDDAPRLSGLVFAVHIWNPTGKEPQTMWEVMNRQKDVQYSSRAVAHIKRQRQLHRLRHVVSELGKLLPEDVKKQADVRELLSYGCKTSMHVVRLLAPSLPYEDHLKDIDFSREGIRQRREAGYRDANEMLERAPWREAFDPIDGFILHEVAGTEVTKAAAAADA
ncbi:patatin-like phospholipase family protein [Tabrizicola sp.]|uniref:patatin-like phospholipase family protein n=1 Tax=Tabrizicola sp. TaxID=2005166 RepID=UPI003F2BBCC7